MPTFDVRLARDDDRDAVIALIGKFVPGDPVQRFDWLYRGNPHGRALTWLAVTRDGEPAACTSMFPRRIRVAGRERLGAIGGDCWVEHKFRRMGLATTLHRHGMQEMRERGVEFMFGPPARNNLAALVKAGSRIVTRYLRWGRRIGALAIDPRPATSLLSRARQGLANGRLSAIDRLSDRTTRGFTIERVDRFGDEFDTLARDISATNAVVCQRDRNYLEWRYATSPMRAQVPLAIRRDGALVAFVALEQNGGAAELLDVVGRHDDRVIDATLALTVRHAAQAGARDLEVCLTTASPIAKRLARGGFGVRVEYGFQVMGADSDPQGATLMAPDSWHFSAADQDIESAFARHADHTE